MLNHHYYQVYHHQRRLQHYSRSSAISRRNDCQDLTGQPRLHEAQVCAGLDMLYFQGGGKGEGGRGSRRTHWLYVTGKPEIHKLLFLSYKWSLFGVFFCHEMIFVTLALSRHQFHNIPHPDRQKLRIPVPRGWFHPASRFSFFLYPASRLDFKSHPASRQTYVGPSHATSCMSALAKS